MHDSVALTAFEARVSEAGLTVRYRVSNGGDGQVWLFNQLFEFGLAGHEIVPNRAYARLEGSTLVLAKSWREVPDHIDVEVPEVPFLTALAPGESFEETFTVQVPVAADDPYAPQPSGSAVVGSLRLELGWAGQELVPREGRTVRGPAILAHHKDARRLQQLLVATSEMEIQTAIEKPG